MSPGLQSPGLCADHSDDWLEPFAAQPPSEGETQRKREDRPEQGEQVSYVGHWSILRDLVAQLPRAEALLP